MTRSRRDPRTERLSREVAGGSRRRFVIEAAAPTEAGGRPRRDPRPSAPPLWSASIPGRASTGPRWRTASGPLQAAAAPSAAPAAPAIRIVADPAFLVLVLPDAPGGRLAPHDRQLLGAARLIADAAGGAVVLAGASVTEEAGGAGADRRVSLPAIEGYDRGHGPRPSSRSSRRSPPVTFCFRKRRTAVISPPRRRRPRRAAVRRRRDRQRPRPDAAGRRRSGRAARRARPAGLDRGGCGRAPFRRPARSETDRGRPRGTPPRRHPRRGAHSGRPGAGAAVGGRFRLSAGNGVTDFTVFADLAQALGATPGASRVVCDAGLMPRDRQVGASGTVLEATCYIAMGIAGAPSISRASPRSSTSSPSTPTSTPR